MERVVDILERDDRPRVAAVLSACRGVTDGLLSLVRTAAAGGEAHGPVDAA